MPINFLSKGPKIAVRKTFPYVFMGTAGCHGHSGCFPGNRNVGGAFAGRTDKSVVLTEDLKECNTYMDQRCSKKQKQIFMVPIISHSLPRELLVCHMPLSNILPIKIVTEGAGENQN